MQDNAILRAKHLLMRAAANGKPIRVFLGFRTERGTHRLVAVDDAANVCRSLPREEFALCSSEKLDDVAAAIAAGWSRLTDAHKTHNTASAVPRSGHGWRRSRDFAAKKATA